MKNSFLKISFLFLLFLTSLFANVDLIIKKIATLDTGYYNLYVKDCYAFVATNNGLKVLDLSDIKDIKSVSFIDSNATAAYDIAVKDNLLYLANASSIKIIDISNPKNLKLIGEFKNGAKSIIGVDIDDRGYAYLSDFDNGLYVVDVKNPSNPTEVAHINTDGNAKKVKVEGYRAYVADGLDGVKIFDISNPLEPKLIGVYQNGSNVVDLIIDKDILYLANESEGIEVLDVRDPDNIEKISFYFINNFGDSIYSIKKYKNKLFVTNSISGLHILDISDVDGIKEIGNYQTSALAFSAALCKNLILLADNTGLEILKPVKEKIEKIASYESGGGSWGVEIDGKYAYTIGWKQGLKIVDISDITSPKVIGHYKSDFATDIKVSDGYAYITNDYGGLDIVDIKNPKEPKRVSNVKSNGAWSVDKKEDIVYVYDLYEGIIIINVSDKKNPKVISKISLGSKEYKKFTKYLVAPSYDMSDFKRDIKIAGDNLFVAAGEKGIFIFDIKDLTNPKMITSINTKGDAFSLGIKGDKLYVAEGEGGVEIYDIKDIFSPKFLDHMKTKSKAMDIAFFDSILLVADENKGLSSFPISDILETAKEGSKDFIIGYDTLGIRVLKDKIFIADENAGLMIFQIIDNKKFEKINKFINFLYINILEREPDREGVKYWRERLLKGKREAKEVVRFFFESDEFKSKNLSDEEFLKIIYRTIFQREPDKEGASYWLKKLSKGAKREDVINYFIESKEFENLLKSFGIN